VTREEIQQRINALCDEIRANEEENRFNEAELDELYVLLDKMPKE